MSKKRTLNFIDFQNDFVSPNGVLSFDNGKGDSKLIKRTQSFFEQLKKNIFKNAIITYDTHHKNDYFLSEESKNFPIHCVENTHGWQLAVDKLSIEQKITNIQYLKKSSYDMWICSIDIPQKNIIDNTDEVVLFGVASDFCNKAALNGWIEKNIPVIILEDLTRGIFKETKEVLKEEPFCTAVLKKQIKLMSSKQFLNQFQNQRG